MSSSNPYASSVDKSTYENKVQNYNTNSNQTQNVNQTNTQNQAASTSQTGNTAFDTTGTTANTGQTTGTVNPWAVQAPFLTTGFQSALDALRQSQANGAANTPSQFVAQFTPDQLSAFDAMLRYGTSNPQIAANSAAAGGALTSAGAPAVATGLYNLAGYNPASAQDIVNSAKQFSDNPQIDAMVSAALRDPARVLTENTLPGIERNAGLTGNINSSRTGAAEAIARRGFNQLAADTSAGIRGQAYNTGLQTAINQAQLAQAGRLGALSGLVSGGTGAVGTGIGANTGAVGQQGALYDIANAGIGNQNIAQNAAIQDALQRYQFGVQSPFAGVNQYFPIVGGANYGSQTTGTATNTGTTSNVGNQTTNNITNSIASAIAQGILNSQAQSSNNGQVTTTGTSNSTETKNPSLFAGIGQTAGMLSSLFDPTGGILTNLFRGGNNISQATGT